MTAEYGARYIETGADFSLRETMHELREIVRLFPSLFALQVRRGERAEVDEQGRGKGGDERRGRAQAGLRDVLERRMGGREGWDV